MKIRLSFWIYLFSDYRRVECYRGISAPWWWVHSVTDTWDSKLVPDVLCDSLTIEYYPLSSEGTQKVDRCYLEVFDLPEFLRRVPKDSLLRLDAFKPFNIGTLLLYGSQRMPEIKRNPPTCAYHLMTTLSRPTLTLSASSTSHYPLV